MTLPEVPTAGMGSLVEPAPSRDITLLASFRFLGDGFVRWGFNRSGANFTGFVQTYLGTGTTLYFDDLPIEPPIGQWVAIALEFEPNGGNDLFRIRANGATLKDLVVPTPSGTAAFALGGEAYGDGTSLDVDLRFDEIVIENY